MSKKSLFVEVMERKGEHQKSTQTPDLIPEFLVRPFKAQLSHTIIDLHIHKGDSGLYIYF